MASEKENKEERGDSNKTFTEMESDSKLLEKHYQWTSKIIESWPSWKRGLIGEMSRSFATIKHDGEE